MRCFIIGTTRDLQLIHTSLHFFKLVLEVPIPSTLDRFEVGSACYSLEMFPMTALSFLISDFDGFVGASRHSTQSHQ